MATIGGVIKIHFRTSDIIGRIGLSEFVVYVKDIQSDKAIYTIADQLCKEIEALHSYEHTKNGLAASIGIALHKGEQEYQTLMANANTALVMAKKIPTSSFEVFSGTIS
jgi:diguanylate cyclase (GGDEF)-like protein